MSDNSKFMNTKAFRLAFGKKGLDLNSKEEKDTSKEIIKWGKKNDLPQNYVELYYGSPLHQGIINGKVAYVTGGGFEILEGDEEAINSFLKNGKSDFTLDEVSQQSALDKFLVGWIVVKLVFANDGSYSFCEILDGDLCRIADDKEHIRISDDWTDSKETIRTYPIYDKESDAQEQVLVFKVPSKRRKKEKGIYPKPDYFAGRKDIEADKEISIYGLNEILNGFTGGTVINDASGVPETDEEKDQARKKADKFTGADNAGSVILNYSDGQEYAITIQHLTGNQLQDRYNMVDKRVKSNILMSHTCPNGMLVGIKTEGQLGGATELETSFNIWVNTTLKYDQKFINDIYNWIMNNVAGIPGNIGLQRPSLFAVDTEDQSVLTVLNTISPMVTKRILEVMTDNEIREIPGLPAVVGGDNIKSLLPEGEPADFQMDEDEKAVWMSYGVELKDKTVFFSKDVEHGLDSLGVSKIEPDYLNEFFDDLGTLTARETLVSILDLLNKGERLADIPEAVDKTLATVSKHIQTLKDNEMIDEDLNLTERGKTLLEASEVPSENFEVRYTYELRSGIDGPEVIDTTRDFCRELLALNRAFTRQEIDEISAQVGRDVFFERGGWYHNPETGRNTPFCRHTWKFILIETS